MIRLPNSHVPATAEAMAADLRDPAVTYLRDMLKTCSNLRFLRTMITAPEDKSRGYVQEAMEMTNGLRDGSVEVGMMLPITPGGTGQPPIGPDGPVSFELVGGQAERPYLLQIRRVRDSNLDADPNNTYYQVSVVAQRRR